MRMRMFKEAITKVGGACVGMIDAVLVQPGTLFILDTA